MSNWRRTTWGEVSTLKYGKALRGYAHACGMARVYGTNGPVGWSNRAQSDGPGVIIGRKGAYRGVHYSSGPFWVIDTAFYLQPKVPMDLRWAYYVLTAYDINSMDSGSAIPSTSRSDFYALPLLLPSLREQEAIAEVLSAIDDKIAVNHRAADASLDLAIEVFRHAIQQFSSAPIALSDAAKWMSGGTPTTTERSYWGGDIPWISALSLKSPWIDDSDRKVTALGANNGTRLAPKDTVIFVVRGSSLDTEFRVGLTRREVAFGQDCKALRALPGIDPALLFIALKSATSDILKLVDHTGHGAGRLATDMIGPHSIRLPAGDKAPASTALIRSLIDVGGKRQAENQNLGQLRDTLRSKLVTGQLRLHDAERLTGVAK